MAYKCVICGKGRIFGHNVSHSKRRTQRAFLPNLRWAKLNGKKERVCMDCWQKLSLTQKANLETEPTNLNQPIKA